MKFLRLFFCVFEFYCIIILDFFCLFRVWNDWYVYIWNFLIGRFYFFFCNLDICWGNDMIEVVFSWFDFKNRWVRLYGISLEFWLSKIEIDMVWYF